MWPELREASAVQFYLGYLRESPLKLNSPEIFGRPIVAKISILPKLTGGRGAEKITGIVSHGEMETAGEIFRRGTEKIRWLLLRRRLWTASSSILPLIIILNQPLLENVL